MKIFVPGRTEITGNHTDHQLGRVIASGVKLGMHAHCRRTGDNVARVKSGNRRPMLVELDSLEPREAEKGTTAALIRGMAWAMSKRGYKVAGFAAEVESDLRSGGGLSSSAAFCVLIGRMISELYNWGKIDPVTIARCAQEAENLHFGKPSGLMDQLACAVVKPVYIDFFTDEIIPIDCSFEQMGLVLCLTDTGGSHAGLTDDYAAIPADMKAVAAHFGKENLRSVDFEEFLASELPRDRAYYRAKHFFEENERVPQMLKAMQSGDGSECMRLMNESGRSSEQQLKNIRCDAGDDKLEKGLALSAKQLEGRGAWRVHGGGFAGCVQALMPKEYYADYAAAMEMEFGAGSCFEIM